MTDLPTFAELVRRRAEDDSVGLRFEEQSWTWRQGVSEATVRGELARRLRRPGPWHIGVLLENTPEHLFWLLGATTAGATVVGLNPTRRGPELGNDIRSTDCQLVVTDAAGLQLLDGLDLGLDDSRVLDVESPSYEHLLATTPAGEAVPCPSGDTVFSLVFTSGTTSAPKAVVCSQRRLGRIAAQQQERRGLTHDDVFYVVMPMFHSNAVMAGIAPAVITGGTVVLRRRFSASGFLPDVRKYGVTFFNYVGKPLSYILHTPERTDDADNPLRIAFGNEASERDIEEFSRRFGCTVIDSFGSSEGEIRIVRTPGTPPGSLGVAPHGTVVMNPETLTECPPAEFDAHGRLLNADEAIGEIVDTTGAARFEGYYRNLEAERKRLRNGWVWSGDLAYRDQEGFWYFAGRTGDWLRVDGENLAVAPIERLLTRFASFGGVAVVAVPDPSGGDQILAVVEMAPGERFDHEAFSAFLASQPDLGTKWPPRYVRIVDTLPRTATGKLLRRELEARSEQSDDLWVREGGTLAYRSPTEYEAGSVRAAR